MRIVHVPAKTGLQTANIQQASIPKANLQQENIQKAIIQQANIKQVLGNHQAEHKANIRRVYKAAHNRQTQGHLGGVQRRALLDIV